MQINGISPLFTPLFTMKRDIATPSDMFDGVFLHEEDLPAVGEIFTGNGIANQEVTADLILDTDLAHRFGLSTGWASGAERATAYSKIITDSVTNGNNKRAQTHYSEARERGYWEFSEGQRLLAKNALDTIS